MPLPAIAAQLGQRYGPDASASSLLALGSAGAADELRLVNTTVGTVMDGMVTALGMPYVRLLALAPGGEQALSGFRPGRRMYPRGPCDKPWSGAEAPEPQVS